jgi:pilus assembly protein CpaB
VLPGTRVDVLATVNPTDQHQDITSKVILTNVQVLAAGTKIERDVHNDKPIPVSVVTLLVAPEESERLTLASSEGKIQLALRNPLDKATPVTPGIKPAALLGMSRPSKPAKAESTSAKAGRKAPGPVTQEVVVAPAPTVEMIRGDKRSAEVIK